MRRVIELLIGRPAPAPDDDGGRAAVVRDVVARADAAASRAAVLDARIANYAESSDGAALNVRWWVSAPG